MMLTIMLLLVAPPAWGAFVAAAHAGDAGVLSITVSKPTGTVDNDIMFAFLRRGSTTDPTTVPTGWALLADVVTGSSKYWLYWKLAASEGASYQWVWEGATARTGVSAATYRGGFNTASPIDVVSNTNYAVSDTINRAASMTVTAANSTLVFFGGFFTSTSQTHTQPTNPGTFVEDVDTWDTDSRFAREIASLTWSGSGSTGAMDATMSLTTADKHAFAVALNPAPLMKKSGSPLGTKIGTRQPRMG